MLLLPPSLVNLLTFPGVIVHEVAHRFFCDLFKIPVYKICCYRFDSPSGYVIHGPIKELKKSLFVSLGPLIINTILCMLLTFVASIPITILEEEKSSIIFKILIWLGFSIGMHAFPSNTDMKNIIKQMDNSNSKGLALIFIILLGSLFRIANALRFFWFDAFYAFGISLLLPWLFGLL